MAIKVGDHVDSTYGTQHRGVVVKVSQFRDGHPMFHVRRDSDGFVWLGWPETTVPVPVEVDVGPGCCDACEGKGGLGCWDCRGTGHTHPETEDC